MKRIRRFSFRLSDIKWTFDFLNVNKFPVLDWQKMGTPKKEIGPKRESVNKEERFDFFTKKC